jgi:hypothetical protein
MSVAEVISWVIGVADAEKWDLGFWGGGGWNGEAGDGDGEEEEDEDENEDEEERFGCRCGCSHDYVVVVVSIWVETIGGGKSHLKRSRRVDKYIDWTLEVVGKISSRH